MNHQLVPVNKGNWSPEEDEVLKNVLNDWPGTIDDKIVQMQRSGVLNRTRHAIKYRASYIRKMAREVPIVMCNWHSEEDAYVLQALTQPYKSLYSLARILNNGPLSHRTYDAVWQRIQYLSKTQTTINIPKRL